MYYVTVWCDDCYNADPMGCFDGGSETLGPFDIKELAEETGESYMDACTLYSYTISECGGNGIHSSLKS
jgi:hypothetical protein